MSRDPLPAAAPSPTPLPAGHPAYAVLAAAWRRRWEAGRVTADGRLLPAQTTAAGDKPAAARS